MGALIFAVVAIGFIYSFINKINVERRLDNYPVDRIDNRKLYKDIADGVSVAERRRRCVNGYYDYDKR